jgi:hypothetical protein
MDNAMKNKRKPPVFFKVLLPLLVLSVLLSTLFFGFLLYGAVSSYFGTPADGFIKAKFYVSRLFGKSSPIPARKINAYYTYPSDENIGFESKTEESVKAEKETSDSLDEEDISIEKPNPKPKAKPVKLTYKNSDAEVVNLKGTFSVWQPIEMTRKGDEWETTIYVFSGKYKYYFEVDGKKVLDPLTSLISQDNSVLVVP